MPAKTSATSTPLTHPPLGTHIDNDSLELVQVLGVGGYGVVYRAVDTLTQKSYAVKCLIQTQFHPQSRQRMLHMREILLHQLASNHPNIVTLHRVVEQEAYTFIIMDYASDGDLFTQILNHRRYLGNDRFIQHVFLQMLDAVEYCHHIGIYHRDLKPENVLCFDNGLRVAITDFGLATTDKVSEEFRTGSVYHMSPECQGGEFAPTGSYSPMFNDIWSLAIILLNLATGRNPWKSASASDPTFQAFLQDPTNFLPTVLPISNELNAILVRMLEVDWRDRMTLSEVRQAIEEIDSFYSPDAIFDGSMARCPWEAGMDIDASSSSDQDLVDEDEVEVEVREVEKVHMATRLPASRNVSPKSCWSDDSSDDLFFRHPSSDTQWDMFTRNTKWTIDQSTPPMSPTSPNSPTMVDSHISLNYSPSPSFFNPSFPPTPDSRNMGFGNRMQPGSKKSPLFINTDCIPGYYGHTGVTDDESLVSSIMHTACEGNDSSFFLASPPSASCQQVTRLSVVSPIEFTRNSAYEDECMDYSFACDYSTTKASSLTVVTQGAGPSSGGTTFIDSSLRSPDDMLFPPYSIISHPSEAFEHSFYALTPSDLGSSHKKWSDDSRAKLSCGSVFHTMKLFPRRSPSPPSSRNYCRNSTDLAPPTHTRHPSEPFSPASSTPRTFLAAPVPKTAAAKTIGTAAAQEQSCRRNALLRSPRHWFSPKLFAGAA